MSRTTKILLVYLLNLATLCLLTGRREPTYGDLIDGELSKQLFEYILQTSSSPISNLLPRM